jgi:cell division topological specificity factor
MATIMERITGSQSRSATSAKERLKLVLIHDRTDISPTILDQIKDELLVVLSRYVEIDPEAIHISISQEGREQRLVADIPIKSSQKRKIG